ncbi:MAG: copper chaperone PCu(A)C [Alphaproteobacteria bacterium]|nr:copper chaperone PCu(A)C [Alphaproteobacteria bacterium]
MNTLSMRAAFAAVFLALACTATQAADANITLQDAHAQIVFGAKVGAAYLRVTNGSTEPDRLVAVSTPMASKAELHSVIDDNGVMKMRLVEGIALKPGETVELKPGGLHVMLMDIQPGLKPGDTIPLTLTFEKAGVKSVSASVDKPAHGH